MSKKNNRPVFYYAEPSDSLKKALDLLKPRRRPGTENDDALADWAFRVLFREQFDRLGRIADYYNIDLLSRDGGLLLAVNLARDFVDGFDPLGSRRGAPRKVMKNHGALVLQIMQSMNERNLTLSAAIEASRKTGQAGHGKSHEKIEAIYHRVIAILRKERHALELAIEQMKADNASESSRMSLYALGDTSSQSSFASFTDKSATENTDEIP